MAADEEEMFSQKYENNSSAMPALDNTKERRHAVKGKKPAKFENMAQSAFLWS